MKIKYLFLFMAAFLWGTTFVAQRTGMDYVGPFTFAAVRNVIGFLFLIPFSIIISKIQNKNGSKSELLLKNNIDTLQYRNNTIKGGIICGIILFVASNLQQMGLVYVGAGKAGFITSLYVVLVPVLGLFFHKKVGKFLWLAVTLAIIGLFLICVDNNDFSIGKGELLILACALFFSFHIMTVDHFVIRANAVAMSCIQFFIVGILSTVCMFIFENPEIDAILKSMYPILYAGILSSGVAYTFQILGQKGTNPTIASLVMCLESVISVLAGWIVLKENLASRQIAGCVIMFLAIIIVQFDGKKPVFKEKTCK